MTNDIFLLIWVSFGGICVLLGGIIGSIFAEIFIERGELGLYLGSIVGFGIAIIIASYQ